MKKKIIPLNKKQLIEYIKKEIFEKQSVNGKPNWKADLNHIDVSNIEDFSFLFSDEYGLRDFQGDMSEWDVSGAVNMSKMFYKSKFTGDISKWDVSNVKDMSGMFQRCFCVPTGIGEWNVGNVEDMSEMFADAFFQECTLEKWHVEKVKKACYMFQNVREIHKFGMEKWKLKSIEDMTGMFRFLENVPFNPHQSDLGKWTEYISLEVLPSCDYRNYTLPSYADHRDFPKEIKTGYGLIASIVERYWEVGFKNREEHKNIQSAVVSKLADIEKFEDKKILGEYYLVTEGQYEYLMKNKKIKYFVAEMIKEKINVSSLKKVYVKYEKGIKSYPALFLWAITHFPYRHKFGIREFEKMNDKEASLLRSYLIIEKLEKISRNRNMLKNRTESGREFREKR